MSADCPPEDDLVRLVEGALNDESMCALEAHADHCEHCAAVIANLGALGTPVTGSRPITDEVRRRGAWPAAGPAVGAIGSGPPARPTVRRNVGRYQLDRRIAAGGMGEVWAAWDPQLRREIAVKLVRPERADDGRERERLLREARALARFTHPNVIAVHDVGWVDGEVFLATELVIGDTLANRGGAGADWRTLARLYAQAARGLAAAHAAGLVHRDVKPANLLLGADGRVRVVDFGLAVRTQATQPGMAPRADVTVEPAITRAGYIPGTPAYMAPEQRAGTPADARSDQFALCVALGEAIAGRRPPMDVTRDGLIEFVAERRAREPALDALCAVVSRGLSIDPEERHPDMTAVADAIDAAVFGFPTPAARPRSRRIAIVVAILLAAALGGGAVWLALRGSPGAAASASSSAEDAVKAASPMAATPSPATAANPSAGQSATTTQDPAAPNAIVSPTTTPNTMAPTAAASNSGADRATASTGAPTKAPQAGSTPPTRTTPPGSASPDRPSPSAGSPPNSSARTTAGGSAPARPGSTPPPPTSPSARPSPPANPSANDEPIATPPTSTSPSLADVTIAIQRRDARACTAAIAAVPPGMANDIRVAGAHAICRMLAGDCDAGTRELEAVYTRQGTPASSASLTGDDYCPLTSDPITRRRRLFAQTSHFMRFECSAYVAPARAVAREATSEVEKRQAASVLTTIAKCYSARNQCDEARELLGEAQQLLPGLTTSELAAQCR